MEVLWSLLIALEVVPILDCLKSCHRLLQEFIPKWYKINQSPVGLKVDCFSFGPSLMTQFWLVHTFSFLIGKIQCCSCPLEFPPTGRKSHLLSSWNENPFGALPRIFRQLFLLTQFPFVAFLLTIATTPICRTQTSTKRPYVQLPVLSQGSKHQSFRLQISLSVACQNNFKKHPVLTSRSRLKNRQHGHRPIGWNNQQQT